MSRDLLFSQNWGFLLRWKCQTNWQCHSENFRKVSKVKLIDKTMDREMTTDHFLSTRCLSLTCLQLNLWFFKCISWFTNVFCLRRICRDLSFRTSQTRVENLYPTFNEPTIDPRWIPFIFQNSFSLVATSSNLILTGFWTEIVVLTSKEVFFFR